MDGRGGGAATAYREVMTARLVDAVWLASHLHDPDLRVIDATVHLTFDADGAHVEGGAESFREGHVPGAVFVDQVVDLSDAEGDTSFTVPPSDQLAAVVGAAGVGNGTTVVVYDKVNTIWATRLWWHLGLEGHDDVVVLDGGFDAWVAAGGDVATGDEPAPEPATFTARRRSERVASTEDVESALEDPAAAVVCALGAETYAGGHIPGSGNVGFDELLREDGTFRPTTELRGILDGAGLLDPGTRPVTYCGGGIAATTLTFALGLVGRDDVAVYDGSLNAWTADGTRSLATG